MFKNNKNILNILLIAGLLIFTCSEKIIAQYKSAQFKHLVFEKGVPHNYIYNIYQDQYGFMWFCSLYGLVKYDGKQYNEFTHDPEDSLSISSDEVISIYESNTKDIWIGTIEGGLNKLDRRTGKFSRFINNPEDSTSISNNTVWSIQKDSNNNLWIGTSNGINILKCDSAEKKSKIKFKRLLYNKNLEEPTKNSFIRSILIDKKDRIWVGVFGEGFYYYDREKSNFIQLSSNIQSIVQIIEDASQSLWLATWGQGLIKVDVKNDSIINKETIEFKEYRQGSGGPISDFVWSLEEDKYGNLWIGTNQGLNRFDRNKNNFILYRHTQSDPRSLSSNQVASLYEDNSGVMWIGAYQGGIDKFIPYTEKFIHLKSNPFNPNSLSNNNVGAVFQDSFGYLWIGTNGGGLNKYDIQKSEYQTYYSYPSDGKSLSSNYISAICDDISGNLWLGTYKGVNYFDNKGKLHRITDINEDINLSNDFMVNAIKSDRLNNVWIGTNKNGLVKIENNKITKKFINNPSDKNSLSHNNVLAIIEDSFGQLWIGTYNGLNKLVLNKDDFDSVNHQFVHFEFEKNNAASLSDNNIYCIYEDTKMNLWIGTSAGLNKFDHASESFTRFTMKHGLPNNVVNGILEDNEGNLWISTNKGLSKFNPLEKSFINYDVQDGLQSNVFGINTNCMLKSGELVFGGINGVNIFNPKNIYQNNYVPPIVFTNFKKYGESICSDLDLMDSEIVNLDYEDKYFTIEFAALDYTNPEKNQYAYKLEGFDDDWIYCGNKNFADYTNISPGTYTFKVIGTNNDAVWNKQGASIKITILPPFWQTIWFKILAALIFVLLMYLLIYSIKKQEKRKSQIKEQIVELRMQALRSKMNPHFIFNTINSIQYFLTCNEQKIAISYLSKFARLMRSTLELSDKQDISIAKELEAVQLYLGLEKLRFEDQFDYEIVIDPSLKINEYRIPNMLIQPYVENAVKHGIKTENGKGFISVKLKKINSEIEYTIEDNGIGISKSFAKKENNHENQKSRGMEITRNRLQLLANNQSDSNNIEILDLNDLDPGKTGTRITIKLPIINLN